MEIYAENKRASFDYEILQKYEAGIVLTGQEVKSIRSGRMGLFGSFVVFKKEEPYLIGANVPAYQPNNLFSEYDPQRSRKLLLTAPEIKELVGKSHQKSLTMVPLRVYNHNHKIKVQFAVVRGKRKSDKREAIKRREAEREIAKALKS
ncbi:MAG: SsrA-binding protein SmpB [Patescibacteria group bacterium]|nr:SsrA-binding protein SmpB [Patescibacteria group bacterium]